MRSWSRPGATPCPAVAGRVGIRFLIALGDARARGVGDRGIIVFVFIVRMMISRLLCIIAQRGGQARCGRAARRPSPGRE